MSKKKRNVSPSHARYISMGMSIKNKKRKIAKHIKALVKKAKRFEDAGKDFTGITNEITLANFKLKRI